MAENKGNSFWDLLAVSLFTATVTAIGTYVVIEKPNFSKIIPKGLREKFENKSQQYAKPEYDLSVGDVVDFLQPYRELKTSDFVQGFREYMEQRKYREQNK